MSEPRLVLTVQSSTACRWFGFATILLVVGHLESLMLRLSGHPNALSLPRLFDMDQEMNVPALFSTGLFLLNGGLFLLIGKSSRSNDLPSVSWFSLAAVFLFLGIDENCQIHEYLNLPVASIFPSLASENVAWILPYAIGLVVLSLALLPFFLRLPARFKGLLVLAAAVFLLGAVVFELLGARHREFMNATIGSTYNYQLDWRDGLLVAVEESLELVGLTTLTYVLLEYLRSQLGGLIVRLDAN